MAETTGPGMESRTPLSKVRILRAAMTLADEAGLEAVTMRKLGQELRVEAMSLYNHVANKDEILDLIVDAVVGEFAMPSDQTHWRAAVRHSALSAHAALLRHPWASRLLVVRSNDIGPAHMGYMDSVLGCLRRAGFSAAMTHRAYHALDFYLLGYTFQQVSFSLAGQDLTDAAAGFLSRLDTGAYPYLVEHVEHHMDNAAEGGGFEFGLDLILDGLERIRDTA